MQAPLNTAEASDPRPIWTGGQYSVFRVLFGTYLCAHFVALIPWGREMFSSDGVLPDGRASPLLFLFPNVLALADGSVVVTGLIALAAALSIPFALGWRDRAAALGIWYVGACLYGRNPLISNPSLPFVGWMLLAHVFTPPAPYGSWERARRDDDPGAGWRPTPGLGRVAWILMALGYSYSGYTKLVSPSWVDGSAFHWLLQSPLARPGWVHDLLLALPPAAMKVFTWGALGLELTFAPLALVARLRPVLWLSLLAMHLGLVVLIDFADLSLGMVLLHLYTFDPGWVRPRPGPAATILYDGGCGLCHRFVRFVLSEDSAAVFRFAPLDSEASRSVARAEELVRLGDTVIVVPEGGPPLARADAVLFVVGRLGGLWGVAATVVGWLPRGFANHLYDAIARIRHRLFSSPKSACPVVPLELRGRFR